MLQKTTEKKYSNNLIDTRRKRLNVVKEIDSNKLKKTINKKIKKCNKNVINKTKIDSYEKYELARFKLGHKDLKKVTSNWRN